MSEQHFLRLSVRRKALLATSGAILMLPAAAWAQTAGVEAAAAAPGAQPESAPASPSESEAIVVTGSRITRSRDYVAASPISTVSSEALLVSGQSTIGEALNQLPQLSANASSTSGSGGGAGGAATNAGRTLADLRGLGSARTLVLIDGARIEPSDAFNRVDMSIVPTALIENAEIITGGASSIYGSDALAGVINLKLKQRFTGLQLDGQIGGTTDGGGANFTASALMGANFKDNRGNIVLSFEHQQRNSIPTSKRPDAYNNANIFFGATNGQVYLFAPNQASQSAVNSVFAKYGIAANTVTPASSFGFNSDGSIFADGPGGGAGSNLHQIPSEAYVVSGGTVQSHTSSSTVVQSPLSKNTAFLRGHYELADNVTAYVQGFYSAYETKSYGRAVPILYVPVTNPFIPSDLATLLASRPNPTEAVLYNSVSSQTPIVTTDRASVWQITGGLRGNLGIRDWTYDASGSIGQSLTRERIDGLPDAALLNAAINAPDGGASFCTGGVNLFPLTLSEDCQAKILKSGNSRTRVYQRSIDLNVQGSLFQLPAGDLRFAAGFDYRINGYDFRPDTYLQPDPTTGAALYNAYDFATQSPAAGSNNVKEGFIELSIPVLAHKPFADQLSLDVSYRYANYRIGGGANSYTVEGLWAPSRFLRFRGGYQHAIRAPSPGEAFAASIAAPSDIGSTANGGGDPCSVDFQGNVANAASLRQLCIATGVPAAIASTYTTQATGVVTHTSGNPELKPETGNSFTAGVVITSPSHSPLLDGLSLSLDFYTIKVTGAIGAVTGAYVLDSCYNVNGGNPTYDPNNAYCRNIVRAGAAQAGAPNYINTPLLNLGAYKVSGLDVTFNWQINTARLAGHNFGRIGLTSTISYLSTYSIQNTSDSAAINYAGTIGNNQISGYSHPRYKATTMLTYGLGQVQVGGRWRYISSMDNALNVLSTSNAPGVPTYNYFDVFASYRPANGVTLQAGMNNIANKTPPYFTQTAPFTDSSTYDVVGRAFYVRGSVKF